MPITHGVSLYLSIPLWNTITKCILRFLDGKQTFKSKSDEKLKIK